MSNRQKEKAIQSDTYFLPNTWEAARERLSLLETIWDPWTMRHLGQLGIRPGWHCLEIAGGAGSIASWLCQQVGPEGHVVATDLEPRFLEQLDEPDLEVWRHNLLTDDLPTAAFDLVHARAILTFLPDAASLIRRIVETVRPGGLLVLEEPDYASVVADATMDAAALALSEKGWDAMIAFITSRGYDTQLGRRLYGYASAAGLCDIEAEGMVAMQLGGTATARFWRVTFEQFRDPVISSGRLSASEADAFVDLLESPGYRCLFTTLMTVSGRRPQENGTG
jgi:2-polyprenyl-3-methyl-5-hydroxy-6-metoxy-1,4-benzoquinol methylase